MTLPREVSEAISAYTEAARLHGAAGLLEGVQRKHAAALAALESAILSALSAAREGALREAADVIDAHSTVETNHLALVEKILALASGPKTTPLPPEIVDLLRDVASGVCTPDVRGRAGAALVRRDLVGACSRCGGSGYERIGDGSVNAWGACEVCRHAPEPAPESEAPRCRFGQPHKEGEGELCRRPSPRSETTEDQ